MSAGLPRPPRLAVWLLARTLPTDAFEAVSGDLNEDFGNLADRQGPTAARRWYWREVLAAIAWRGRVRTSRRTAGPAAAGPAAPLMHGLGQDIRFGVRMLSRSPGFAVSAVLTLALGIGGATTIVTAAGWALFRPLPFDQPDRLVHLGETNDDGTVGNVGFETLRDWQARSGAFDAIVPIRTWQPTLLDRGPAERLNGLRVGWEYFQLLGVRPALGRDFTAEDDQPDRRRVVIISHGLWQSHFGGRAEVVGESLSFNGAAYEVVGVLPADFEPLVSDRFYTRASVWAPLGYAVGESFACRSCRHLRALGRLSSGEDLPSAAADLAVLHAQLTAEHPGEYGKGDPQVVSLRSQIVGRYERPLEVVLGAVGLLLLITCANVAGLIIARSGDRQREVAVRAALGAGRRRIGRQLVTESLVLASAATAIGIGTAKLGLQLMSRNAPSDLIRLERAATDPLVWLIAIGVGTSALLLFGLLPALDATRVDLQSVLRATRQTAGRRSSVLREGMIVAQVAVALVLVISGGLMYRTVGHLLHVDTGFDPEGVLTAQMSLVGERWAENPAVYAFQQDLVEHVEALPGVERAAITGLLPLGGSYDRRGFGIEGQSYPSPDDVPSAERYSVTPPYFEAMGIRLRRGRLLGREDTPTSPPVALVNETAVYRYWSGQDPVGQRIKFGSSADAPWITVVGVVDDVRHYDLETPPIPQLYVPQSQSTDSYIVLVTKAPAALGGLGDQIRAEVAGLAPDVPVYDVVPLEALQSAAVGTRRFLMRLLALFAVISVLLASVGLYGVIAQTVRAREREIGIRLSLGAGRLDLLGVIAGRGMALTGLGIVLGLAGAAAASGLLESQLFSTAALDPATYATGSAGLLAAAAGAHLLPLRRAMRVDPNLILRGD